MAQFSIKFCILSCLFCGAFFPATSNPVVGEENIFFDILNSNSSQKPFAANFIERRLCSHKITIIDSLKANLTRITTEKASTQSKFTDANTAWSLLYAKLHTCHTQLQATLNQTLEATNRSILLQENNFETAFASPFPVPAPFVGESWLCHREQSEINHLQQKIIDVQRQIDHIKVDVEAFKQETVLIVQQTELCQAHLQEIQLLTNASYQTGTDMRVYSSDAFKTTCNVTCNSNFNTSQGLNSNSPQWTGDYVLYQINSTLVCECLQYAMAGLKNNDPRKAKNEYVKNYALAQANLLIFQKNNEFLKTNESQYIQNN
eukprot:Sdes_comp9514_c0_seq1m985